MLTEKEAALQGWKHGGRNAGGDGGGGGCNDDLEKKVGVGRKRL